MSITAPDDRISTYNPVVATTEFAANFPVFDNSDLIVIHDGAERTDFTVSATYAEGISTNAKAVFNPGITGNVWVIGYRDPRRTNRFQNGAPLPIWAQNLALDTLEGEMQEARRDIGRSHKAPFGEMGGVFSVDDIASASDYAAAAEEAMENAEANADRAEAAAALAGETFIIPETFLSWNPADAAPAIGAACAASANTGGVVRLTAGKTYNISKLTIASGAKISGIGAVLRCAGGLTVAADRDINIGANCIIDEFFTTRPAAGTNGYWVEIGVGTKIGKLTLKADAQWSMNGVITTGQDVRIDFFRASKIERVFDVINPVTATPTTGLYVGYADIDGYRRGFYLEATYDYTIGGMRIVGRSPNVVSILPGMNAVLLAGCSNGIIGNIYCEGAGEHVFRVGASPDANVVTDNVHVGNIIGVRCAGTVLKLNPTRLASAGVTEKCRRLTFGDVIGVDVGDGAPNANSCLLRLTHAYQVYIRGAYAFIRNQAVSAQFGLLINDCDDVMIGTLGGDNITGGFISIDGTSDVDGALYFGGDVTNIRIGNLLGRASGNNAIGVNTAFNIGDFTIMNSEITGWAVFLLRWDSGVQLNNTVFAIEGRAYGAVAPAAHSGVPATINGSVQINIKWLRGWAALTAFSETTLGFGMQQIDNGGLTAGQGNYGGGLIMTRLGGGRRGAAIVGRQFGATAQTFGLEFLVSTSVTASDTLLEAMRITHEQALQIRDGISAPATANGWASLYVDSADGDLKVKFGDGVVKTIVVDT